MWCWAQVSHSPSPSFSRFVGADPVANLLEAPAFDRLKEGGRPWAMKTHKAVVSPGYNLFCSVTTVNWSTRHGAKSCFDADGKEQRGEACGEM